MKLHWQEPELHRSGRYRVHPHEVDLIFIEHELGFTKPARGAGGHGVDDYEPLSKAYQRPVYTVAILRVKGKAGIFAGVSRFSGDVDETFNYQRGQKLALGRALKQAFPGKPVSRRKAWLSYRLQVEVERVKKEQLREAEKVSEALHQSRLEEMSKALLAAKSQRGVPPLQYLAYDIEAPFKQVLSPPGVVEKVYLCGCSNLGLVCSLHSDRPRVARAQEARRIYEANKEEITYAGNTGDENLKWEGGAHDGDEAKSPSPEDGSDPNSR